MENHKTPPEEIAYEHCVLCGGVTAIRRETSVSERADYIYTAADAMLPMAAGADRARISSGWAAPLE